MPTCTNTCADEAWCTPGVSAVPLRRCHQEMTAASHRSLHRLIEQSVIALQQCAVRFYTGLRHLMAHSVDCCKDQQVTCRPCNRNLVVLHCLAICSQCSSTLSCRQNVRVACKHACQCQWVPAMLAGTGSQINGAHRYT